MNDNLNMKKLNLPVYVPDFVEMTSSEPDYLGQL